MSQPSVAVPSDGVRTQDTSHAYLDHVGLDVADIEAQVAFYRHAFDLDVENDADSREYDFRAVMLRGQAGWRLELFQRDGAGPRPKSDDVGRQHDLLGIGHVCFTVPELQGMFDRLVSLGASVRIPPSPSMVPGMTFAFVADPEGNLIEQVHRD